MSGAGLCWIVVKDTWCGVSYGHSYVCIVSAIGLVILRTNLLKYVGVGCVDDYPD